MVADGYKQTDIGVLPEDWKVGKLIDNLEESPKYGINAAAVKLERNLPVYIRITDISTNGYYRPTEKVGVNNRLSNQYLLSEGDIVLARTGASVGKSYRYRESDGVLVYAGFLIKITPEKSKLNEMYLSQYLQTSNYWDWIRVMSMRSGQPGINGNEYGQLPIPIPPKPEQKAIATALSDTDELINSLEKLISKKEAIKTGTMQELLTGKKRLDGFSGKWEEKTLGDIVDVVSGGTPSSTVASYWNGTVDWYTPTEIGKDKYVSTSVRKITEDGFQNCSAKTLPIGTILFTSRAGIGNTSILTTVGCTNQGFQSLVAKKNIDNEFVYYLVSTLTNKFLQNASGSTFLEISPNKVREIDIFIPQHKEQQAISTILSDMDSDIDALKAKLSKVKAIKEGMMQELLTGKIRLI